MFRNFFFQNSFWNIFIIPICLSIVSAQNKDSSVSILQDLMEDPKFSVDFMDFFIAESSLPQFLHSDKALPGSEDDSNNQTLSRRLVLRTDKGERFLCDISTPLDAEEEDIPLLSPEEQARVNQEGVNRGIAALNSMKDKCLAMRAGWWTYKFCYNGEVSQFHIPTAEEEVKEGTPINKYVLGTFANSLPVSSVLSAGEEDEVDSSIEVKVKENISPDHRIAAVKATPNRNVLVQRWGGGTPCDLNKEYRSVEIHYQCFSGKTGQIISIKEPRSCHYLLEIGSPQLCNDPFYAEKNVATIHPIKCAEVVPDLDLDRRQKEAAERAIAKKELEDSKSAKAKKLKEAGSQFSNIFTLISPGVPGGIKLQNILQGIINQNQPPDSPETPESTPESDTTTESKDSPQGNQDAFLEALSKLLKFSGVDPDSVSEAETKSTESEEEEEEANYDEL